MTHLNSASLDSTPAPTITPRAFRQSAAFIRRSVEVVLFSTLIIFCLMLLAPRAQAKNCLKGKPCGNSCISMNDVCHVGAGSASTALDTRRTEGPTLGQRIKENLRGAARETRGAARSPASDRPLFGTTAGTRTRQCKTGKACGNSCIALTATCHENGRDETAPVASQSEHGRRHSRH